MSLGNFVIVGCAIGVTVTIACGGFALWNKPEPVLDADTWGRSVINKFNQISDNAYEVNWDDEKRWKISLENYLSQSPTSMNWQEFRNVCAFRISEVHKDSDALEKIKKPDQLSLINHEQHIPAITYEHCIALFKK